MLNNEFRLIGTIVSDFEVVANSEAFPKKTFKIEVEKKAKGKSSTYSVVVYERNNLIDMSKSLEGKAVILVGYIDEYNGYLKLVAQDIYLVGVGKAKTKKVEVKEEPPKEEEPAIEGNNLDTLDLPDDDLPF